MSQFETYFQRYSTFFVFEYFHAALVDKRYGTAINHVLKNTKKKSINMLCMVGIIEGHFGMATSELFLCT